MLCFYLDLFLYFTEQFEPISLENDLALLELSSAVALQENIIPVCLHTEEDSLGTYVITKILPPQPIYILCILQSGLGDGSLAGVSRAQV